MILSLTLPLLAIHRDSPTVFDNTVESPTDFDNTDYSVFVRLPLYLITASQLLLYFNNSLNSSAVLDNSLNTSAVLDNSSFRLDVSRSALVDSLEHSVAQ